jgi:uncharacterized repeat protein (TIGR03843 family)
MADGHRYGVDHGITFHTDHKLRTVLWGWVGEALTDAELSAVRRLGDEVRGALGDRLSELLTDLEIEALARRCERLAARRSMPCPRGDHPAIPWPPF